MRARHSIPITLIVILSLLGGALARLATAPTPRTAYIEPGLLATDTDTVSIIVTAGDPQAVRRDAVVGRPGLVGWNALVGRDAVVGQHALVG